MTDTLFDLNFWSFVLPSYSLTAVTISAVFNKSPQIGKKLNLKNVSLAISTVSCLATVAVLSYGLSSGAIDMTPTYLVNLGLLYFSIFVLGTEYLDSSREKANILTALSIATVFISIYMIIREFNFTTFILGYLAPLGLVLLTLLLWRRSVSKNQISK